MAVRMQVVRFSFAVLVLTLLVGCASSGSDSSAASSSSDKGAQAAVAPPSSSPLSKVTTGMSDAEVRKVMGDPDDANAYMTGKAFIPFYYGPDTHRSDWVYKGQGRVVFSRNRWSGSLKVISVLYNPNE